LADLTIRPTAKFVKAGLAAAGVVLVVWEIYCLSSLNERLGSQWAMILPLLLLVWVGLRAMRRQVTRTVITADRLRYESGVMAKATRTIQLSKVQDVRVDQRLMQRIWGVGDLSIETAGESSRLTIPNVDGPQALADELMNRAQHGPGAAA
jgi:uncharacterized membrane protein YdbT with pleckstrin-like domain